METNEKSCLLISKYEQPFVWNKKTWREHIESVLMCIGEYETDCHIIHNDEYGYWYLVTREYKEIAPGAYERTIKFVKSYRDMDQAIDEFMMCETLPEFNNAT